MDADYISNDQQDLFDPSGDDDFKADITELDEIRITNTILLEKQSIDNEFNSLIYNLQCAFNLNELKSKYENKMMQIEQQYHYELQQLNKEDGTFNDDHKQVLYRYEGNCMFLFNLARERIEVGFFSLILLFFFEQIFLAPSFMRLCKNSILKIFQKKIFL
jgi:hypothetical protein